jgi:hypothetical protein
MDENGNAPPIQASQSVALKSNLIMIKGQTSNLPYVSPVKS